MLIHCLLLKIWSWHEHAAFQRPTSNDVSCHKKLQYFIHFFFSFLFLFFPSSTFLIEGTLGSKTLFRETWRERPFPDTVGHFGAPWQPFWIFEGLHRRNGRIKKLIYQKLVGGSNNLRFNLFLDNVGHFGLSGRLGVAGGAALQAVSECPRRR